MTRDDPPVLIHKAFRHGLFQATQQPGAARATAPTAAFETILDVAERTRSPSQFAGLQSRLNEQPRTPVRS